MSAPPNAAASFAAPFPTPPVASPVPQPAPAPAPENPRPESTSTQPPKKPKAGSIKLRILIDAPLVSPLIGKGGQNIQKLHSETGAFFKVLEAGRAAREQVLVLMASDTEQMGKAVLALTEWFVRSRPPSSSSQARQPEEKEASQHTTTQLRMCVFRHQAGAVIGQKGANVRSIVQESGARVQVLNGFLGQSTEQEMQITGTPSSIQKAVVRILGIFQNILQDDSRYHEDIVYQPMPLSHGPTMRSPMDYYPPPPHMHMMRPNSVPEPFPMMPPFPPFMPPFPPMPYPPPHAPPPSGIHVQATLVPSKLVGYLIGKAGSFVKELRQATGATVVIEPEVEGAEERVATITGSPQGVHLALSLVKKRLAAYDPNYKKGSRPPQPRPIQEVKAMLHPAAGSQPAQPAQPVQSTTQPSAPSSQPQSQQPAPQAQPQPSPQPAQPQTQPSQAPAAPAPSPQPARPSQFNPTAHSRSPPHPYPRPYSHAPYPRYN